MPSQKSRSKDDTWTTDELSRALHKTGERRHHKDRDEERKRDRINGDEKHRRHRDDDSDRRRRDDDRRRKPKDEDDDDRDRLTEEDREKLRQERRQKRETKDGGRDKKQKEEVKFRGKSESRQIDLDEIDDDDRHKRHRSDKDRRHKDDRDRDRRHKDDDRERRRRHDDADDEEAERERRREDRRRQKEDDERKRKPDEKSSRHRDRDERSDRHKEREERHRDKDERRRSKDDRHKDKEERHRNRDDRDRDREERHKDRDREEREREKEREERRREREERHKSKDSKSSKKEEQQEEKQEEENGDDYEEDFEDYEEDFEEDDDEEEEEKKPVKYGHQDDELNDVLRALDEENDRLLNSSSKSPAGSSPYGRSENDRRQHRYNDHQESDSDDDRGKVYQPRTDRPKTAINFVSAKQRAINRKTSSKTMQRGHDLLKMIELDYANFDILDLPPVGEYDMYIRAFGSTGTRQVYIQTNDDNIDRDIQTEEVDVRQKWTQHPAEDFAGCGRGDGEKDVDDEEDEQAKQSKEQDTGRLNNFLQKAGQVIAILLEEEKVEEAGQQSRSHTHLTISEGYTQLTGLSILTGRHVLYTHFSPTQPNLLLTVYSPATEASEDNPVSKRGIICVWNTNEPTYPQKILACGSQPRCCCFSPVKPSLVFAGMVDGSIAMWDLREPNSIHQPTTINEERYSVRYPTYDTAGVLPEENHHSPVSAIMPVYSYVTSSKADSGSSDVSEDSPSGLSFQLISAEEAAVLNFWVVAELASSDPAGSQTDFGLAPGATVKLLKSSSLVIGDPNSRDSQLKASVRALDMRLLPSDPNQFYLTTDSGKIIHGMRFGKRAFPRAHSPVIETIVDVYSIDFSPFDQPCFIVGCSDGSFSIYHTRSENPLVTWSSITKGKAVNCVRWSRSRPCVFYVLDASSTLYIFDLLEGDSNPKHVETVSKEKVTSLSLTNDHKADGLGPSNKDAQILFSLGDGTTEIHTVSRDLRDPQDLEKEFLGSYLQRF